MRNLRPLPTRTVSFSHRNNACEESSSSTTFSGRYATQTPLWMILKFSLQFSSRCTISHFVVAARPSTSARWKFCITFAMVEAGREREEERGLAKRSTSTSSYIDNDAFGLGPHEEPHPAWSAHLRSQLQLNAPHDGKLCTCASACLMRRWLTPLKSYASRRRRRRPRPRLRRTSWRRDRRRT